MHKRDAMNHTDRNSGATWRPEWVPTHGLTVASFLLLALLVASAVAPPAAAAEAEVPALSGRVVDQASLLPPAEQRGLESRLAAFEASTGHQVAVLTVSSLGGEPIETYSMRVVEAWELGRAEADDGVLLLIAQDDRQMRLEVGYGLEGELTDMASRRVLDNVVAPRFRQGDFAGGVTAGVEAVIAVLEEGESGVERFAVSEPRRGDSDSTGGLVGLAVFVLFAFQILCGRGCVKWGIYTAVSLGIVMSCYFLFGPVGAGMAAVAMVVVLPVLSRVLCAAGGGVSTRGGSWTGGFGGGGGGFSGGGFSGGGGSFGGGGASSSW